MINSENGKKNRKEKKKLKQVSNLDKTKATYMNSKIGEKVIRFDV